MLKQKIKNSKLLTKRQSIAALVLVAFVSIGIVGKTVVYADQFDDQIKAIQQDNSAKNANLSQLGSEAASYTEKLNKLQSEIATLEAQIHANQAKSEDLQRQIVEAEAELAHQREVLGESIRQVYIDGQISTLEMLATSKDLSDFVDKQQYRNSVRNKIKDTVDKINLLKTQLKQQKDEVEIMLKEQQAMQGELASQRNQQQELLSYNQQQQADLNSQLQANKSKIAELKRQQQEAINAAARRIGVTMVPGTGNGGYPNVWANAPGDSMVDSWGMYNRECVSFAAYKVAASGRYMPYWGGRGNANQWPGNAERAGIPTGYEPRVGAVAFMDIGYYGHVMYVEEVLDGGARVRVSQYNWGTPFTYSQMIIPANSITSYIYFQ